MAVLIFHAVKAPLAQPRNVLGGMTLSAFVGVVVRKVIAEAACDNACDWFAAGLAVALSIVVMVVTRTVHPPGGATALIAVLGTPVHAFQQSDTFCRLTSCERPRLFVRNRTHINWIDGHDPRGSRCQQHTSSSFLPPILDLK